MTVRTLVIPTLLARMSGVSLISIPYKTQTILPARINEYVTMETSPALFLRKMRIA